MEFSEAEPTPFHAVTASCSRPNGRVNRGLQVLPRSSSVFRISLLTHVTTYISCHDTNGIQIQRWRWSYILRKTIEGYGFCFVVIAKGIIFSTQIINRYVAEPSLCKDSIKFSRCLEALIADLQKRCNTPEIEVPTVVYPTHLCHSSPLTGSFNCETVLIIEMPVLLCLKCILGNFQKSVIFG